ncbi:hypothetical protein LZC95_30370 [Pendulispora brunnea]|uniref:Uncharacterized protein n=1 Tax=Pendulispora brunnea TaxID=2905690 RepID=A0ABZ2JWL9_9BACT
MKNDTRERGLAGIDHAERTPGIAISDGSTWITGHALASPLHHRAKLECWTLMWT